MIVLACTFIVSISAAVFVAAELSARETVKTSFSSASLLDKAKEINNLSAVLVTELERIKKQNPKSASDLNDVIRGIETIIKFSWELDSFYGKRAVIPFLNVLHSAAEIEASQPSDEYIQTLQVIIKEITPHCAALILGGERGTTVINSTFKAGADLESKTSILGRLIQDKIENDQFNSEDR